MRKVILYIAVSLDGYIAKNDGSVDWLDAVPNPNQDDYGYYEFYDSIDTTLMGNKTYQQVLSFGIPFPYPTKTNYVFSRTLREDDENVHFIGENISEFVCELKRKEGSSIWLIGGGQINAILLDENLIDEMIISVMPVTLGSGLPLFAIGGKENMVRPFELKEVKSFRSGVVQSIYVKM